ncbi:MAG: hypothetical protein ABEH43_10675, partial [Flavobacteriales bacterium]
MKKILTYFIILFINLNLSSQSFDEKVTEASNVGMTVTNVGTIGNGFNGSFNLLDYPSCEFPRGSGVEHLFEGGIWVGALVNGTVVSVSTAALDDPSGYSTGKSGFEFTAEEGASIEKRSSLFDSPDFKPSAISHEDYIAEFTDSNITVPGTNIQIQDHEDPLNIEVHLETYNWNFPFSDFFIILDYTITNVGDKTLDSLYTGIWTNSVVRNVNVTPAGQGGTAFFNKGGNGYEDSLNMAYGFDATGDPGFTDSYFAHK